MEASRQLKRDLKSIILRALNNIFMKLTFIKNSAGEIVVKVKGENFVTRDYIEMVKQVKANKPIEAEFDKEITKEEKDSVNLMLGEINKIGEAGKADDKSESDDTSF